MSNAARELSLPGRVVVEEGPEEVSASAAETIEALSADAIRSTGVFTIALTGGTTPRPLYERLSREPAASRMAWDAWRVYFGDERAVAPDDPQSNYAFVKETLLDRVPIPAAHVHRMQGESPDLDIAAATYSTLLEATLPRAAGGAPSLDVVLLGLGENGHVASLFPGTATLAVHDRWATRGLADYAPFERITLTFPAINAARTVALVVTGASKAAALRATAAGTVPASLVSPESGSLIWFLDREAARGIA